MRIITTDRWNRYSHDFAIKPRLTWALVRLETYVVPTGPPSSLSLRSRERKEIIQRGQTVDRGSIKCAITHRKKEDGENKIGILEAVYTRVIGPFSFLFSKTDSRNSELYRIFIEF